MYNKIMDVSISVVIPNWNGVNHLRYCLPTISKQNYKPKEIILVDNGSKDKSIDFVKNNFPSVKILTFRKNRGFATAVNIGIKKSKANYVLILNNDTKFNNTFLKELSSFFRNKDNKKICAITPKIIKNKKPYVLESAGNYMNNLGQAFHRGNGELPSKYNKSEQVFLAPATALLVKKKAFYEIGLFDETMFAYGEDVDWAFRAQLLGYRFLYEPKAKIYHKGLATGKKLDKKLKFYQYRNYTYFILKCFPTKLLLKKARAFFIFLIHFNTFKHLCLNGFIKEAFQANCWILKNIGLITKKRAKIQSNVKINTNYLESTLVKKKI
jgi:GT2 family glycosyltransferase